MNARQTTKPPKNSSAKAKVKAPALALMKRPPEPVLFEYHNGAARKVCIAGSFNEWKPDGLEMIPLGDGKWAKELVLPPGTYEYRLIADGKWIPDPAARNTVPNPFGEVNSTIVVESGSPPARTAARQSL